MKHVTFVFFGGTGDLTRRKLVPAIAQLLTNGTLAKDSLAVGVGRTQYTHETYRQYLLDSARDEKERECIAQLKIKYYQADSSKAHSLDGLASLLEEHESPAHNDRVYYLATTYQIFASILRNIKQAGLHKSAKHFTRIVFEKPFGHSYSSAKQLEKHIHTVFDETQVFRIDHYLGKETVQNISSLKFTNPIIESLLNSAHVEQIDVEANEDIGVGNRLGYYDSSGAVKDMIQSHLLQVVSLVLMQTPQTLNAKCIHDEKVKVLRKLHFKPATHHILGQYQGYAQELEKAGLPLSTTETFARLELSCENKRWKGTKIFLQTGKNLHEKAGRITIHFAHPKHFGAHIKGAVKNKMIIDIQPSEDIRLLFNTRKRHTQEVVPVEMEFCGTCTFGPNTADGYALLLRDAILGDRTLFTRNDELLASWRIVDEFEKLRSHITLRSYKPGAHPDTIQ